MRELFYKWLLWPLVLAGFAVYVAINRMGWAEFSKAAFGQTAAAWVQAVGAILALVAVYLAAQHQAKERARERDESERSRCLLMAQLVSNFARTCRGQHEALSNLQEGYTINLDMPRVTATVQLFQNLLSVPSLPPKALHPVLRCFHIALNVQLFYAATNGKRWDRSPQMLGAFERAASQSTIAEGHAAKVAGVSIADLRAMLTEMDGDFAVV